MLYNVWCSPRLSTWIFYVLILLNLLYSMVLQSVLYFYCLYCIIWLIFLLEFIFSKFTRNKIMITCKYLKVLRSCLTSKPYINMLLIKYFSLCGNRSFAKSIIILIIIFSFEYHHFRNGLIVINMYCLGATVSFERYKRYVFGIQWIICLILVWERLLLLTFAVWKS